MAIVLRDPVVHNLQRRRHIAGDVDVLQSLPILQIAVIPPFVQQERGDMTRRRHIFGDIDVLESLPLQQGAPSANPNGVQDQQSDARRRRRIYGDVDVLESLAILQNPPPQRGTVPFQVGDEGLLWAKRRHVFGDVDVLDALPLILQAPGLVPVGVVDIVDVIRRRHIFDIDIYPQAPTVINPFVTQSDGARTLQRRYVKDYDPQDFITLLLTVSQPFVQGDAGDLRTMRRRQSMYEYDLQNQIIRQIVSANSGLVGFLTILGAGQ